ncbi:helix-turn-helix domain-containing protein [Opitutus terrae]|uniref:Transcriptional regulator, XRE family n=1 Tax=Opitutus terrae (strain DSM 11246 / JCM 15787 / PB90-1) TaxID=452637 RepID=B1ZUR6_OPITP|nr:helix-turn-helix domain-containing protein [Opitutus terrae]ACB74950.1 transcriptional regulator, XRE family [Opitutus terrae PB90-1]
MQTIGERLEEARKKKGISIREAAEATKIRGDYLSKFENNQFDINLTELYVRGFLRSYAQFLRLPADRILNDYAALGRGESRPRQPSREIYGRMDVSISSADEAAESAAPNEPEAVAAPTPARRPSPANRGIGTTPGVGIDPALLWKIAKWVGIGLVAIVLLWGIISLFSGGSSEPASKAATAPASAAASSPVSASPVANETTITLHALEVVRVGVVSAEDGRVILPDITLNRGQSRTVSKSGPIYIRYSAGRNLEVEVNGKRYPMPTDGMDRAMIK